VGGAKLKRLTPDVLRTGLSQKSKTIPLLAGVISRRRTAGLVWPARRRSRPPRSVGAEIVVTASENRRAGKSQLPSNASMEVGKGRHAIEDVGDREPRSGCGQWPMAQ
jgi:hypothetical protein